MPQAVQRGIMRALSGPVVAALIAGCAMAPAGPAPLRTHASDQGGTQATAVAPMDLRASRKFQAAIDLSRAAIHVADTNRIDQAVSLVEMAKAKINAIDKQTLSDTQKAVVQQVHAAVSKALEAQEQAAMNETDKRNAIIRNLADSVRVDFDAFLDKKVSDPTTGGSASFGAH